METDTAPKGKVISIGGTNLFAASGITKPELADEGYAIDEKDGNLFLLGGATRGPINAVYALLEEDLGCRWYSRFSQTIPNMPTLKFRPAKRSYVPVLEIRDPFYWEAFDGTWSLRNRTNSPWRAGACRLGRQQGLRAVRAYIQHARFVGSHTSRITPSISRSTTASATPASSA